MNDHQLLEVTRYQLLNHTETTQIAMDKKQNKRHSQLLFIAKTTIVENESESIKNSRYQASALLTRCLKEKNDNHAWNLYEIEQILYRNPNAHFECYFQEWYYKKYNDQLDETRIEYAHAVFIEANNQFLLQNPYMIMFEQFISESHPILQNHIKTMKLHYVSIQEMIVKKKTIKHILLDQSPINHQKIQFNAEEKSILLEQIQPIILNGVARYATLLFPYITEKNKTSASLIPFTCRIYYLPESEQIIYIDHSDINGTAITTQDYEYIIQEENIIDEETVDFCYSQDYIKGKNTNQIIKKMMLEKARIEHSLKLKEEDDIIDIVGQNFFDQARAYIALHVNLGDQVQLLLDKTNIYDRYAILVMHNGKGIGYVSSKKNLDVNFYLLQNSNIKSYIYEFDKEGKSTYKIKIENVKNVKDKEPPSIKYEKYIYELPLENALSRINKLTQEDDTRIKELLDLDIKLLFLSMIYKLYVEILPHSEIVFQPFIKTVLYQIFGPKSAHNFQSLFDQQWITDYQIKRIEFFYSNENKLIFDFLFEYLNAKDISYKHHFVDIVIDFLNHVADNVLISKKKHRNIHDVITTTTKSIQDQLKNLLF